MKKSFLLLNGQMPKTLPELENYEFIICADGAYHHFLTFNPARQCDVVIGDFDSVSIKNAPTFTQFIPIADQNTTDFDKALQFLSEHGVKHVDVYGATGKENDHFFSNISTAIAFRDKLSLRFVDDFGQFFLSDFHIEIKQMKDKIMSLIPFCEANHVSAQGLRYPLKDQTLRLGEFISVRNQAISDCVEIAYKSGTLLIFIAH